MRRIFDISQLVKPGIPVWTGDAPFEPFWTAEMSKGAPMNVGGVKMSLHTGTHADAPKHYREGGRSIAEVDLEKYVGPALVVDLSDLPRKILCEGITPGMIKSLPFDRIERMLFKTGTANRTEFIHSFAFFRPETARLLSDKGVRLVGIDTPSVDFVDSKSLDGHHLFDDKRMAILENLNLSEISAGWYELIALPLRLDGMDASPVRAILRTME